MFGLSAELFILTRNSDQPLRIRGVKRRRLNRPNLVQSNDQWRGSCHRDAKYELTTQKASRQHKKNNCALACFANSVAIRIRRKNN